ncbi:MAG: hypothetical protein ACFCVG_06410 [Kineosporiaceae bacterium]
MRVRTVQVRTVQGGAQLRAVRGGVQLRTVQGVMRVRPGGTAAAPR